MAFADFQGQTLFKINGYAIKTPQSCEWQLMDLQPDNTGRTLDGLMHISVIAKKRKLVCKWPSMSFDEATALAQFCKFAGVVVSVTYPDIAEGGLITKQFYTGDLKVPLYDMYRGLVESVSCDFIEV